jgi:dihydroxyacid dehydratase/phosphogluconate dehydratase
MKRSIIAAFVVASLAIALNSRAADEKTITGDGMCAKCELKETKSCQNAVKVKEGIRAAGGTPMEFNTIAISDGETMGTEGMRASLVSREVIADSIELVCRGQLFDAVVCVVGCDKTIPAAAMAIPVATQANPMASCPPGDRSCLPTSTSAFVHEMSRVRTARADPYSITAHPRESEARGDRCACVQGRFFQARPFLCVFASKV